MDAPHPGIETEMLATKETKMRALLGRQCDWRGELAIIVQAYSPQVVNLIVISSMAAKISVADFAFVARPLCFCSVFWRHSSGVQFVALVTRLHESGLVDLLVLGDGCVDLGAGPSIPIPVLNVQRGQGHLNWQTELDL